MVSTGRHSAAISIAHVSGRVWARPVLVKDFKLHEGEPLDRKRTIARYHHTTKVGCHRDCHRGCAARCVDAQPLVQPVISKAAAIVRNAERVADACISLHLASAAICKLNRSHKSRPRMPPTKFVSHVTLRHERVPVLPRADRHAHRRRQRQIDQRIGVAQACLHGDRVRDRHRAGHNAHHRWLPTLRRSHRDACIQRRTQHRRQLLLHSIRRAIIKVCAHVDPAFGRLAHKLVQCCRDIRAAH